MPARLPRYRVRPTRSRFSLWMVWDGLLRRVVLTDFASRADAQAEADRLNAQEEPN